MARDRNIDPARGERRRARPARSRSDGSESDLGGGGGHRHARLAQVLHEELGAIARDELIDPALDGVRFTAVELSVDYKNARVRFVPAVGNEAARSATERALQRATPFLRARLAEAIALKHVPLLRFVLDREAPPALLDVDAEPDADPDALGR